MKIGVFVYNFEHKKSQEGLLELFLNGIQPDCIFAADPVSINFYQSKIRIAPKGIKYIHPRAIARKLNIPYYEVDHSGHQCLNIIKERQLDLGVILGARILRGPVVKSFNVGILNMHPGLLPENRGLDNVKWAIIDNISQGVTSHLIDDHIDRGLLIDKKTIDVYQDDTLIDITLRIQNLELKMMVDAIRKIENEEIDFMPLGVGKRNVSIPASVEMYLGEIFESYKERYMLQSRQE